MWYYKGMSRCFCYETKHVEKINKILKEIDEHEHDYMPDKWVTLYNPKSSKLVYSGKYEPDVHKLIKMCADNKIGIFILSEECEEN